jgi:hypothetical protein
MINQVSIETKSSAHSNRKAFFPLIISVISHISNIDCFKKILLEAYMIMKSEDSQTQEVKNLKLLNYFIFLNSILKPPTATRMTVNLCITLSFRLL